MRAPPPSDVPTEIPWEGKLLRDVERFAADLSRLRESNLYKEPTLQTAVMYLVGELIDYGFSTQEITSALSKGLESGNLKP